MINRFLVVAMVSGIAVLAQARSRLRAEEPVSKEGLFRKQSHAALLEVQGAILLSKRTLFNGVVHTKTYQVTVVVKECLPHALEKKTFSVSVEHAKQMASVGDWYYADNWFPTTKGAVFVAAFNPDACERAGQMVCVDSEGSAKSTWHQCGVFYQAISQKKESRAEALAQVILKERQRLDYPFWKLIQDYDSYLYLDKIISLALARYLRDPKIPVAQRITALSFFPGHDPGWPKTDPPADRAIVLAAIDLLFEVKGKTSDQDDLNSIFIYFACFVSSTPSSHLPWLTAKTRKKLWDMIQDKRCAFSQDARKQVLLDWLKNVVILTQRHQDRHGHGPIGHVNAPPAGLGDQAAALRPERSVSFWLIACAVAAFLFMAVLLFAYSRRKGSAIQGQGPNKQT